MSTTACTLLPHPITSRAQNTIVSRYLDLDGLWKEYRSLSQYEVVGTVSIGQHPVYQVRRPGTVECSALKEYTVTCCVRLGI